jgi:hypothetical protein
LTAPHASEWASVDFAYSDQQSCDREDYDLTVLHWVGLHHAHRARREAMDLSRAGNAAGARKRLRDVARRIRDYAGEDADLLAAQHALSAVDAQVAAGPVAASEAKKVYSAAQRRSRWPRDRRDA